MVLAHQYVLLLTSDLFSPSLFNKAETLSNSWYKTLQVPYSQVNYVYINIFTNWAYR
jgi:hypothetical protein